MPRTLPVKALKNTTNFIEQVQNSTQPITITKNGYDVIVAMRSDDYEQMQEELARARLYARIAVAEHEYATGQHSDGDEFMNNLRETYDL